MWVVTDGEVRWVGEGTVNTGRGRVNPHDPPEWATVFPARFLDELGELERGPQVVNSKDVGLLVSLTGVGNGWRVAEGGSGSGYLTAWLAHLVGDGHVYSYEVRDDFHGIAKRNIEKLGFYNVTLKKGSIFEPDETELDMLIMDVPNPWAGASAAHDALRTGGYVVAYLPTANQVRKWLIAAHEFADHSVVTSMNKEWRPKPDAFRPRSKTLAHTAFVCVARRMD